jgi:hypothetical protein
VNAVEFLENLAIHTHYNNFPKKIAYDKSVSIFILHDKNINKIKSLISKSDINYFADTSRVAHISLN